MPLNIRQIDNYLKKDERKRKKYSKKFIKNFIKIVQQAIIRKTKKISASKKYRILSLYSWVQIRLKIKQLNHKEI